MTTIYLDTLNDTVEHYIKNYQGNINQITYMTNDEDVTYYADKDHPFDGKHIMIYAIHVKNKRQGTFKRYLQHLVDNNNVKKISILAICSFILDEFLDKVTHCGAKWKAHGADRYWVKPEILCIT